eukprot:gene13393-9592_t
MRTLVFSSRRYFKNALNKINAANGARHQLQYLDAGFDSSTAPLCEGFDAALVFVNDKVDRTALETLAKGGTRMVSTLSTGTNHIDLNAAKDLGITVTAVPKYSPNAISEFTVGMLLSVARNIHRAHHRTREGNFNLDGLEGFELREKTIGVYGAGSIGRTVIRNLSGFGCKILAYDPYPSNEVANLCTFVEPKTLFKESDVLTFHTPLIDSTRHLVNDETLATMKRGVVIVNTSRGGIIDTPAALRGLKSGQIGSLAIDVYEGEGALFFEDRSCQIIPDDTFARLLTYPNVLVTGHQAFLTETAINTIASTTLGYLSEFETTGKCSKALLPAIKN